MLYIYYFVYCDLYSLLSSLPGGAGISRSRGGGPRGGPLLGRPPRYWPRLPRQDRPGLAISYTASLLPSQALSHSQHIHYLPFNFKHVLIT